MIYAEILAAGNGSRMGNTELPKQFLTLGNKPIIIHTIEQFILNDRIEKIIVCTSANWTSYTEDLINKYIDTNKIIKVVEGGNTRDESVMAGCNYISDNYGINDEDIIITHDAVRPFITQRIIDDNINAIKKSDAVDTCVECTDTIVEEKDGYINNIPNRSLLFQGQTPQTFNLKKLFALHSNLSEEVKKSLTDACKIFVLNGNKVKIVKGENYNIKITNMFDLNLANAILLERGSK